LGTQRSELPARREAGGKQGLRLVATPEAEPSAGRPDRGWLLELGSALQTTLEFDKLLAIFAERARGVVAHDSVTFESRAGDVTVTVGTPAAQACEYNVVLLEESLGTIRFTRATPFSKEEMATLENMIVALVYPLRNAHLYREALKVASQDPLTGVHNRTALDKALDREVELARRHRTALSLIMIDVDRFKSINDTYGHAVGDRALRQVAECIVRCARESDIVFRYGGEEFVLLLSNTALCGARFLAERIREAAERLELRCGAQPRKVTVSIGVAALEPGDDRLRLLERADSALYASKTEGRNRVTALPG